MKKFHCIRPHWLHKGVSAALAKGMFQAAWLLDAKLFGFQQMVLFETQYLSELEMNAGDTESPAFILKTENGLHCGEERWRLCTLQCDTPEYELWSQHRPTQRCSHTSEGFWETVNNTDLKNFFYIESNFEQNWQSDRHIVFWRKDTLGFWEYFLCWS